jgi:hypothetical protein
MTSKTMTDYHLHASLVQSLPLQHPQQLGLAPIGWARCSLFQLALLLRLPPQHGSQHSAHAPKNSFPVHRLVVASSIRVHADFQVLAVVW